jgi:hypothetical protein
MQGIPKFSSITIVLIVQDGNNGTWAWSTEGLILHKREDKRFLIEW